MTKIPVRYIFAIMRWDIRNIITDALRQAWQAEIDKYISMVQEEVIIDSDVR